MKNILTQEHHRILNNIPNIILAGVGGSYAYGTNVPTSDIDLRGIYMNPKEEIIGIYPDSEQIVDIETDTTIYSFKKIIKLLTDCNPNTIELLGLRECDYIIKSDAGKILLENRHLFLSKKSVHTFGNYAAGQLNRLVNKSGRYKNEAIDNEIRSIGKALSSFESRYKQYADTESDVKVFEEEGEIFFNLKINNVSMPILANMVNEINNIDKNYRKSSRNDKAVEHNKLGKHMMHLLRLYMMGIDILEKEEIITYREDEHELLMNIRNGYYLESDKVTPTTEFESLLSEYQTKFQKAASDTKLPDRPDINAINKMVMNIISMYL